MNSASASGFASWSLPFEGAMLRGVVLRRDALPALGPTVLLHAGPPFQGEPPSAVRQACVQALLFEGLAADAAQARAMLSAGAVELQPAQDHGVATPLAQVVSASMPLAAVGDAASVAWAPLVEGPPPALRFGTEASEARTRLSAITVFGLQRLAPLLRAHPVALAPSSRARWPRATSVMPAPARPMRRWSMPSTVWPTTTESHCAPTPASCSRC